MPSDINYFNPQAMNPGQDWKPAGFLAGANYAEDRRNYLQLMDLFKQNQQMGTTRRAQELQEFLGPDAPVRQAKRGADIATSQATAQTIGREKLAGVTKSELENQYTQATQASRIATALSDNLTKQGENGLKQLHQEMQTAAILGESLKTNGPAAINTITQQYPQLMQSPVARAVLSSPNPMQALTIINEGMAKASQDYITKRDEARWRNEGDIAGREVTGKYQVQVANIQDRSRQEVARLRAHNDQKVKKLEEDTINIRNRIRAAVQAGKTPDPLDLSDLQFNMEMMAYLRQAAQAATLGYSQGVTQLPGPVPQLPQYNPGQGPKPRAFANRGEAQAARNRGEIKDGDKIVVNGVSGTWRD